MFEKLIGSNALDEIFPNFFVYEAKTRTPTAEHDGALIRLVTHNASKDGNLNGNAGVGFEIINFGIHISDWFEIGAYKFYKSSSEFDCFIYEFKCTEYSDLLVHLKKFAVQLKDEFGDFTNV